MADPYSYIANTEIAFQEKLAEILELRASDSKQQEMLDSYLSEIDSSLEGKVLEIGCGTGAISREIAKKLNKSSLTGVDPSPIFIQKAKELAQVHQNLDFVVGDGRQLDFEDQTFDLVVFHTTLCHIPSPETAVKEAHRVLKRGGRIVIFDGDYVTTTVAIDQYDPLQVGIDKMIHHFVENIWFCRQLPKVLHSHEFRVNSFRSHGYLTTSDSTYMQTLIERGADLLALSGTISENHALAMKTESKRRMEDNEFFAHISYVSAIATKA